MIHLLVGLAVLLAGLGVGGGNRRRRRRVGVRADPAAPIRSNGFQVDRGDRS